MTPDNDTLTLAEFMALGTAEIRRLVQARAPRLSLAMPLNGSRRTWRLQQREQDAAALAQDPLATMLRCMRDTMDLQIAAHRLLFAHGVHTLIAPVVGGILQARSDVYARAALQSLELVLAPPALELYRDFDLQVLFYGNYAPVFAQHGRQDIPERYAELVRATAHRRGGRLLYGLWVPEIGEAEIGIAGRFYAEHGRPGTRAELIRAFYGTDLEWLDIWLGFNKPKVYDVPLIFGRPSNLYFTVTPTAGLSAAALRKVLYDTLYARRGEEASSFGLGPAAVAAMAAYYAANAGEVAGAGEIHPALGCWVPVLDHRHPDSFTPAPGAGATAA